MKRITTLPKPSLILILIFIISTSQSFSQSVATYDIVFTSVWNSTDHGALPPGPHWSKLVGANHNANVTFLQMGQTASAGIERIAEDGVNSVFKNDEVDPTIPTDTQQYIDGNSLGSATGTITISDLEVFEDFPLLTLVSMIAPSPDWMIAVNSIDLRVGGDWNSSINIDLFPYDAGTDNGTSYTSPNNNNIGGTITSLVNVGPFNNQKIGTLSIILKSVVLSDKDVAFDNKIKVFPNPNKGAFTINNESKNFIKHLKLYDTYGNEIKKITNNSRLITSPVQLENLSSGLYFLKLTSQEGFISTKKIIVE